MVPRVVCIHPYIILLKLHGEKLKEGMPYDYTAVIMKFIVK